MRGDRSDLTHFHVISCKDFYALQRLTVVMLTEWCGLMQRYQDICQFDIQGQVLMLCNVVI